MFRRLFRRYGLPDRIRTDNGALFAVNALGRLSRLSVSFIELGIYPELVDHDVFDVYVGPLRLGRFIEADGLITEALGRLKRHNR